MRKQVTDNFSELEFERDSDRERVCERKRENEKTDR